MKIAFTIHITTVGHFLGLRFFLLKAGRNLGLNGTIDYITAENSLSIHVEGNEKAIRKFIAACSAGNPYCKVGRIVFDLADVQGYDRFDIITTPQILPKEPVEKKVKPAFRFGLFGL